MSSSEFDAFYASTVENIAREVLLLTGDATAAEKITCLTFCQAWRQWRTVRTQPDPEAWVRAAAAQMALSPWLTRRRWIRAQCAVLIQRIKYGQHAVIEPPRPWASAGQEQLFDALERLPRHHRHPLVLHHALGVPIAEIALETEATEKATANRLRNGRARLFSMVASLAGRNADDADGQARLHQALHDAAKAPRLTFPPAAEVRKRSRARDRRLMGGVATAALGLVISPLACAPGGTSTASPTARTESTGVTSAKAPVMRVEIPGKPTARFVLGPTTQRVSVIPTGGTDISYLTGWQSWGGATYLQIARVRLNPDGTVAKGARSTLTLDKAILEKLTKAQLDTLNKAGVTSVDIVPLSPNVAVTGRWALAGMAGPITVPVTKLIAFATENPFSGVRFALHYDAKGHVDRVSEHAVR